MKDLKKNSIFLSVLFFGFFAVIRLRDYGDSSLDFQVLMRLGSWAMAIIWGGHYFLNKKVTAYNKLEKAFHMFLLFSFLTLPLSMLPTRSAMMLISWVGIYLSLKVFYVKWGYVKTLVVMRNTLFILVLISFFYYFFLPQLGRHIYWHNDILLVSGRMSGITSTSNAMGVLAAILSILTVYMHYNHIGSHNKIYLFIALLSLLLTNSKTSLIGFFLASYFILPQRKNFRLVKIIFLNMFIFIVALLLIYPELVLTKISRHGDVTELLTFTGRTSIWPVVFQVGVQKPIIGHGLGVTSVAIPQFVDTIGYTPAHAHNLFLQAFFCQGILGVGFISYLLITPLLFYKNINRLAYGFTIYLLLSAFFESLFLSGIGALSIIPFFIIIIFSHIDTNRESLL